MDVHNYNQIPPNPPLNSPAAQPLQKNLPKDASQELPLFDQIFVQTKDHVAIRNQISDLNQRISELEESLKETNEQLSSMQSQMDKLKGSDFPKIILVAFIAKKIFQAVHRKEIKALSPHLSALQGLKKTQEEDLASIKGQYSTLFSQKESLRKQLVSEIGKILNPQSIQKQIQELSKQKSFDSETIQKVFLLNSQLTRLRESGEVMTLFSPQLQGTYVKLYQQTQALLNEKIKPFMAQHQQTAVAKTAAKKGLALQAGMRALENLIQKGEALQRNIESVNQVFLVPGQGVVFKKGSVKAQEEEHLAAQLMGFLSNDALVESFDIQNPNLEHFGIPLNPRTGKPSRQDSLKEHMLQTWGFSPQELQKEPQLKNYLRTQLNRPNQELLKTLEKENRPFYLVQDFTQLKFKKILDACRHCLWEYQDGEGNVHRVNFKKVQELCFKGEYFPRHFQPVSDKPLTVMPDLMQALNAPWTLVHHNLMVRTENAAQPIGPVQAKPFIQDMILFSKLHDASPTIVENVLNRLTPDSQLAAIMTGELQFIDLHGNNLGVAPVPNASYEKLKDIQFFVPSLSKDPFSLNGLQMFYLNGKLTEQTRIEYKMGREMKAGSFNQLKELQEALNTSWKLVLFDTDQCLTENNRLLSQWNSNNKQHEHLIPLRSCLLATEWKHRPLDDKAVQQLMNSEQRELLMRNWMSRKDAPIRKRLSKEAQNRVDLLIQPKIEEWSLSEARKYSPNTSVKALRKLFVKEMIQVETNRDLWKLLENDLQVVTVKPNDTWETLAARYHQEVEALQDLNSLQILQPGGKIRIAYDLTSNKPEAVQRRKQIASDLFPRLTTGQQDALDQRQLRRTAYLNRYAALKNATDSKMILKELFKFIANDSSPLASGDKEAFMTLYQQLDKEPLDHVAIKQLQQTVINFGQPTYFNLMKSMYPLLADAYILDRALVGSSKAGFDMGSYYRSLEQIIKEAKIKFAPTDPMHLLALRLEQEIKNEKSPAFR